MKSMTTKVHTGQALEKDQEEKLWKHFYFYLYWMTLECINMHLSEKDQKLSSYRDLQLRESVSKMAVSTIASRNLVRMQKKRKVYCLKKASIDSILSAEENVNVNFMSITHLKTATSAQSAVQQTL